MAYVDPPTWVDNTTPYLNAANLNTMSANQRDHEARLVSGLDYTNEAKNYIMSGGGFMAWGVVADRFRWSATIYISMPTSSGASSTHHVATDTFTPVSGITDDTGAERANADGVQLNDWESLWAIGTRGTSPQVESYKVIAYNTATMDTYFADENAYLLAVRNGDNDCLYLRNGQIIAPGQTATGTDPYPQYAATSRGLPSGGTAGQVLAKNTGTNYDVGWLSSRTLYKVSGSDVTNTTTSFADVTGLTWAVTSGVHYKFQAILDITSNATTNGFNISMNGPTLTRGSWRISTPPLSGAAPYAPLFTQQVAFNTGTALTGLTATSPNLVIIEGFMVCSASGTGAVRFHSEISTGGATITVKIGSSLEVWSV